MAERRSNIPRGDEPRRCGENGHLSRTTGEPCAQPLPPGAVACRWHGGASPAAKAAAARRVAMAEAQQMLQTYGRPADVDPTDALLEEVRWTAGHVGWLRDRVRELEPDALVWGMTEQVDQHATEFPGINTRRAAVPNVWLELYRAERKHLVDVCRVAIAAGIEERRVRLAERQGALIVQAIQGILGELGLTAEQQSRVPEVVPRHLRLVAG
jgi:hypothetical protein